MKNILHGLIAAISFLLITLFVLTPIGSHIFVGDAFTISYHLFTYMGLIVLCGVIVTCTAIIVGKINEVLKVLEDKR